MMEDFDLKDKSMAKGGSASRYIIANPQRNATVGTAMEVTRWVFSPGSVIRPKFGVCRRQKMHLGFGVSWGRQMRGFVLSGVY